MFPRPSVELLVTLAWTPLVALDVAIQVFPHLSLIVDYVFQVFQLQVCLLAYTMAFQCTLYLLYVGLFVLCHLVCCFLIQLKECKTPPLFVCLWSTGFADTMSFKCTFYLLYVGLFVLLTLSLYRLGTIQSLRRLGSHRRGLW